MKSAESNDKEEKEVKGKTETMEQGVTLEVIMMRLAGIIDHVHLIVFNLHHSPHQDVNLSQKRGRRELVEDQVHLAPPLLVACARVAKSHLQIESG